MAGKQGEEPASPQQVQVTRQIVAATDTLCPDNGGDSGKAY